MMTAGISLERDGAIALITIDRPKANAIDVAASRAMYEAVREVEDDERLRVGIITGAGDRFFSAGWDLKAAAAGERADSDYGPGGFAGITEFHGRRKPLLAAVNGIAFGGGFEIALACDAIVASEDALFALPEAGLGLIADAGGVVRLPRLIGRVRAAEMLMTGRRIDAATALAWGAVNAVVAPHVLLEAAHDFASRICAFAPLSIAAILETWEATDGLPVHEALAKAHAPELRIRSALAASADALEGIASFNEKRAPRWTGK